MRASLAACSIALLVGITGCRREGREYRVELAGGETWPRSAAVRLSYKGKEIPLVRDQGTTGSFSVGGDSWLSDDPGALQVELETPCGPFVVSYADSLNEQDVKFLRNDEKRAKNTPVRVYFSAHTKPPPRALMVHVDRRDGGDGAVVVGSQALAAGRDLTKPPLPSSPARPPAQLYEIAEPTCAAGKVVRIDGAPVGTIEFADGTFDRHVVIDAKGGHCYDRLAASYSTTPSRPGLLDRGPSAERWTDKRVYNYTDGQPYQSALAAFSSCPSSLRLRSSCVHVSQVDCAAKPLAY
jgi:hypothetical protein